MNIKKGYIFSVSAIIFWSLTFILEDVREVFLSRSKSVNHDINHC